jgi:hypothetical protein
MLLATLTSGRGLVRYSSVPSGKNLDWWRTGEQGRGVWEGEEVMGWICIDTRQRRGLVRYSSVPSGKNLELVEDRGGEGRVRR